MGNYTLVIAEKPDAAERIASAIAEGGKPKKKLFSKAPYFELERAGRKVVVVPASGHLYTVTQQMGRRNFYPVFTFKWAPRYEVERGAGRTKAIIRLIEKLGKDSDELVNAADYDVEGSLISYTILKHACRGREKEAKRMKFSTLTPEELNHAYQNLMPRLDFEMAEAGQTRHEVDWLYGVNLSRALILSAFKQSKRYVTLSVGRVQGPTLRLVVQREKEVRSFVPTPYWEIKATAQIGEEEHELKFEKEKIERRREAEEIAEKCNGKTGEILAVEEKEFRRPPPEPFDLGSLQKEAYRFFGYTPRRALDIAERLYLNALISYPRTSSQKLPPTINYRNVLQGLAENPAYEKPAKNLLAAKELKPREGKKEDPAHPAVYPTGKKPERELAGDEAKVYDLITKRFMAAFGAPSVRLSTKISVKCADYRFFLHGRRVVEEGWTAFYRPYLEVEEAPLPPLKMGDRVLLKKVESILHHTEPPPRYNPASLLRAMEENNLGTKATRAEIIETLYGRGYLREERMAATDLGFAVVDSLGRYCPSIVSLELTRMLEEKMEKIEQNLERREKVLREAVQELKSILTQLKKAEEALGVELSEAIRAEMLRRKIVGACPQCGTGRLMILKSRKTRKRFIGCTNFFTGRCNKALPLPQRGSVTTTEKTCKTCGWPILIYKTVGRRPFQFCINPQCPSKVKRTQT